MTPRRLRAVALLLCALPAAALAVGLATDRAGADPVEAITHVTGDWALRFLLLALAVTPARRLLGWSALAPLRRTFGLTAFTYACLHLSTYVVLDHFFDWRGIVEDVAERRYVTAGFAAFLCMVPLAATSSSAMIRRLGARRWQALHRLAYLAAALGVLHFLWLVKADLRAPLAHAAVLALLLGYRAWHRAAR
jgi:sulfoxide reductase heme-binding subunit YedZ